MDEPDDDLEECVHCGELLDDDDWPECEQVGECPSCGETLRRQGVRRVRFQRSIRGTFR